MENLGGAETVFHHGGCDHLVATAAFEEVCQTDCELPKLPKFLNLLTVSATVTEVWAAQATEQRLPGHTSLVTLGRFC